MKVKLVPKGAIKSMKLQHFRKPSNGDFEEDTASEINCDILDNSLEILDGSFSNLKPIGETGIGPNYVSTPRCKDELEEGEITGEIKISEPQCSPITKCEDIDHPEQTSNVPKYEDISEDEINISFNFQTDIVQEKERSDSYIREVERFVLKSSEIIHQKTRKRDELFKKRDKYLQKARRVEEAIRKVNAIVILATKFTDILE